MPINFFDAEVKKCQDRFNETFGVMVVCNIQTRQRVILAIVNMGRLAKKIGAAHTKDEVRDEIKRFVKSRDVLKTYFDDAQKLIESKAKEKSWSNCTGTATKKKTGSSQATALKA